MWFVMIDFISVLFKNCILDIQANVAVLATSVDEKTEQNNNCRGNKINIAVEDNEDTV